MKLRLFGLRNTHTNKTSSEFFSDKPSAKKARDELNANPPGGWVVTPGPDHRRFTSRS